jgi:hypothetical protein
MRLIRTVAMNGKSPKTKLNNLYLPVRCIIHLDHVSSQTDDDEDKTTDPAKTDPTDIVALFGKRCNPEMHNCQTAWKIGTGSTYQQLMQRSTSPSGTTWGKSMSQRNCTLQPKSCLSPQKWGFSASEAKAAILALGQHILLR